MSDIEALTSRENFSFYPETFQDPIAEKIHGVANRAKSFFWYFAANVYFYSVQPLKNQRVESIALRFFLTIVNGYMSVVTSTCAIAGYMLTGIANRLQSQEYIYWKGEGKAIQEKSYKVMHLNACMLDGALPYIFGGVRTAWERMGELTDFIKKHQPDLLFLCEFNPSLANTFYEKTKGEYKDYFVNIGPSAMGIGSSMCAISRVPITRKPEFIPSRLGLLKPVLMDQKGRQLMTFLLEEL